MQVWQELPSTASLFLLAVLSWKLKILKVLLFLFYNVTTGNTIEECVNNRLKCQKLSSDNRGFRIKENFSCLEGKPAMCFVCLNPWHNEIGLGFQLTSS